MGARGPRNTPTAVAVLHGKPSHHKINRREPKPGGDLFAPPSWMSKDQREEWDYIVENSVPGLLTSLDKANLTTYVVAACLHKAAAIELGKAKSVVVPVGPNGAIQQHPALQVLNRQALILLKAAIEMGFTPASRTRIQVNGEVPPPNGKPIIAPVPGGLSSFASDNPDKRSH